MVKFGAAKRIKSLPYQYTTYSTTEPKKAIILRGEKSHGRRIGYVNFDLKKEDILDICCVVCNTDIK